jgi:predicted ATPase/DNA-binding XRE family transcriptional regulator
MSDRESQPTSSEDNLFFGQWLRQRRRSLDLTQEALAQRVGCVVDTVRKIELGMRRPSRAMAERLAQCLSIPHEQHSAFLEAARAGRAPPDLAPAPGLLPPSTSVAGVAPASASITPRTGQLPASMTSFIGREWEATAVDTRLRAPGVRLVTLTGAGGIGKTRLALQIARGLHDAFPQGVWFVNLAPVSDPSLVIPMIAQALGVREQHSTPIIEILCAALGEQRLLIVLDNFEQVVAAAVEVAALLAAVPGLKALVTSREALRLAGEHVVVVAPLAVPELTAVLPATQLMQYAAVRLFVERAQAVAEHFRLTDANAAAVAAICVRLDGLPLAIELAAARVPLFPPSTLLARLERRLPLLTRGPRDLPERQQTLRNTIDWSYDLLNAGEQTLFARLGVFVGGFTLHAAEAVCTVEGKLESNVLDGLAALVDKSLLRQDKGLDREPRVTLLETISEYALERLVEFGEAEALRRAHAAHYLALAEMAVSHLDGPQQQVWLARLEADHDNLRAAILWQVERGNTEAASRFGAALWRFWWKHGYLSEGQNRLEAILALPEMGPASAAHNALRARVLLGAGRLANDQADYPAARSYCEQSQAIYQKLGDKRGVALALETLGQIATDQGDYVAARETLQRCLVLSQEIGDQPCQATSLALLSEVAGLQGDYVAGRVLGEQSLALFQAIGDQHEIVRSLDSLGWNAIYRGDYQQATPFFEQSLRLGRELGQKEDISSALNGLGDVAWYQGDYTRATVLYKEGLALRQELGDKRGCAVGLTSLGETALAQGDTEQAAQLYRESLELNRRIQYMPGIVYCLFGFASISAMRGLPERAARLAGAAAALCDAIGLGLPNFFVAAYDRSIAAARTQLGEEVLAAAWAAGQVLPLHQAIAEALTVTAPGPAHSPPSTIVS